MNMHNLPEKNYVVRTATDTVRVERLLPGPIERVWSYLVDSDKRRQWLAEGAIESRAGGKFEHVFRNSELTRNDDPAPAHYQKEAGEMHMAGTVLAYETPKLLVLHWGGSETQVRFDLRAEGDEVMLTVTHSLVKMDRMMLSVSAGWHGHLDVLLARLEGREPDGFWRNHVRLEAEYRKRLGF